VMSDGGMYGNMTSPDSDDTRGMQHLQHTCCDQNYQLLDVKLHFETLP